MSGERAERTARRYVAAARLAAGAGVVLGLMAGALLWWRPSPAGQLQALAVGGAALGFGVLWVVVLWRAARRLRRGIVADRGSTRHAPAGIEPDGAGDPELLWNWLRLMNLVRWPDCTTSGRVRRSAWPESGC
ncbi:hypothetical protein ACFV9D_09025 [Streptomyces sp. NPDC059875]|uniref:hypothetical protein n=1 Tax=unclassified Streptomyces TaxID=2593676 RepID=UPI0036661895